MIRRALLASLVAAPLAACQDEAASGVIPGVYELRVIDGKTFAWGATLDTSEPGRISGQAPCNAYSATQDARPPRFAPGPIAATRRACLHMRGEADFFSALSEMTRIDGNGTGLVLSNDRGREMVFERAGQPSR